MLGNDNFVTGWAEVCNKQTATLMINKDSDPVGVRLYI